MSANKGPFEPVLLPIFGGYESVPHGIARLVAAQAAHATDLPRLAGATDEEVRTATKRDTFLKSAEKFVSDCARAGVAWDDVWSQLQDGYATARVELTADDEQQLLEMWLATEPQEQAARAVSISS